MTQKLKQKYGKFSQFMENVKTSTSCLVNSKIMAKSDKLYSFPEYAAKGSFINYIVWNWGVGGYKDFIVPKKVLKLSTWEIGQKRPKILST